MNISKNRIALLDEIRGFCVLCMIFYHAFIFMYEQYDVQFGYDAYTFFLPVQPFVSCMFLFICGICCRLSHSNLKRGLKLAVFALGLNFVSIVLLPKFGFVDCEIWWGVLDFFTVCILLYALLERPIISRIPAWLGCLISVALLWLFREWETYGTISVWEDISWQAPEALRQLPWIFPFGLQPDGFFSADYFPLIPYGFVFSLGTYVGVWVHDGKLPSFAYPVHSKVLMWLGQKCFLIYIIELPILFILFEFIKWIIGVLG
ncbi:MAG: heparan-alpha-glucosaminide N-acetyltransferase domain-containing protein [Clostridia bacterium]|nr:heparan-alpha-glucosaminide N-acetyltransferase domain-containing protein [Clostridia bacterium]